MFTPELAIVYLATIVRFSHMGGVRAGSIEVSNRHGHNGAAEFVSFN